jgi:hypothetical protein
MSRPHLLTIGATPSPELLRASGFSVSHAATLLDGYRKAVRRLDRIAQLRPTVILLDLHTTEPGFPELIAPQLVAVLADQIAAGHLHPAWLIGLSPASTPDLDAEARVAGCHHLLRPPLDETALKMLHMEYLPPALVPLIDDARRAYQRAAKRVLEAVLAAQIPIWTSADARVLLHVLTPYPLPASQRGTDSHAKMVLRALGGPRAARQRLEVMADSWQMRCPLHGAILRFFLDGLERREIVAHFVMRDLYEDSRIYACIKELPERLAQELRVRQADAEDSTP